MIYNMLGFIYFYLHDQQLNIARLLKLFYTTNMYVLVSD